MPNTPEPNTPYEDLRDGGYDEHAAEAIVLADEIDELIGEAYHALDSGPASDPRIFVRSILHLISANEKAAQAIRKLASR